MQEFDKQFNKPVDNVILDRPTGTSEAPRKDSSDEERTPRFSKKQKMIGGLTAAALAAGLAVGFGVAANGEKPAESPANTSEPFEPAPVDPIEEPGAGEEEPTTPEVDGLTIENLEIPSGLSTEELASVLVEDRFEVWDNAGATTDLFSLSIEQNKSYNDLLPEVAVQNKEIFAEALYVSDWDQNPTLVQNVNARAERNLAVLGNYVQTAFRTDGPAVEAYRLDTLVRSVAESTGENGERILVIDISQIDNRDQNQITTTELRDARYTITVIEESGKQKIADIEVDIL